MHTSIKCRCTVKKEYIALIARLFEKESYKFYIATDDPYIKLFNIPYNFGKFLNMKEGANEFELHNIYDQQTGKWSFYISFIQVAEEWLWFAKLFVPLYIEDVEEFKVSNNGRQMPHWVKMQLDKTGVNGTLKYLLGEPPTSDIDWRLYQPKKLMQSRDEIRRKIIREQNKLYLDITDTHRDKYVKHVLDYCYAEIELKAIAERVIYNRLHNRELSRGYISSIKPLIFEEKYLPESFEVVISELFEKINNCVCFNQNELPEVSALKLKFRCGNEVDINLSRISVENPEEVERWTHNECVYDY